ncbi:Ctr copper transporter [Kalaharituber pfeilii]|nr:Ctr copper transporter [Kalaharituber pfeilii]
MDHSSHDSSSSSHSSAKNHMMNMAFHNSITDNLFSEAWTPKSVGEYAGIIVFLIVLAIIHRFLVALKSVQDAKWRKRDKSRVVIVAKDGSTKRGESTEVTTEINSTSREDGMTGKSAWSRPWRFSTELPRAVLQTVTTGVGYLLMLAAMTFNVGYFCAVLAGVFVGELAFGRIHAH